MFFTNKHVIIALLISPVLAVLAWFAVGQYAGEQAAPAQAGKSYPLVEQSNCRYDSGYCELANEAFKLTLRVQGNELVVQSAHPLEGILVAVAEPGVEKAPVEMTVVGSGGDRWRFTLARQPAVNERIRLVASTAKNAYYADASVAFIKP